MTTSVQQLSDLRDRLEILSKATIDKKVFIGFDGFVDKIKKAVKQKKNDRTDYFKTLNDFSGRIREAAGKGGQIEMETQKIKIGGNAPILSNTLGKLGVPGFCVGSMGYPEVHTVFSEMNDRCELISALNPGQSDAIEFEDGKIIFSELEVFERYDWNYIRETVGLKRIEEAVMASDLLAFVDWVNLPHANAIWEGILHDVIKPSGKSDFLFLFDLCDPSKKTDEQIDEVLNLISNFSSYGKVTLGLNENEALKIWAAIHRIEFNDLSVKSKLPSVKDAGEAIYKKMKIDTLLIHPIDRTLTFRNHEVTELQGRLVTEPKVQTGGGDNLNAGYCLGLLSGFSLQQCMLLGMATSGAYIKNGTSSDLAGIVNYINEWMDELPKLPQKTESVHSKAQTLE